jgi:hypothetical protein
MPWLVLLVGTVVAMLAALPGWNGRRIATGTWIICWLGGTALAVCLAFVAGGAHFDETVCATATGDCDLGAFEGLLWAAIVLVVLLVAWVLDGVGRVRRR